MTETLDRATRARCRRIAPALADWYRVRRRDLPWRATGDPYRIWLSEIMLQQTQVDTVLPYYARFLEAYPTVETLAAADLDQVLVLWEGLGYYSRARNLHRAARVLMEQYDGQLPESYEALLEIPGIGEYTAGAVGSIAFGLRVPAIDGNVVRVLCRLFDYAGDPRRAAGKRTVRAWAEALLPKEAVGEHNQALMELGATVCSPRAPLCGECPLSELCLALERDTVLERPMPRPRRTVPLKTWAVALCERQGRILIVRRIPSGLLGGLWELPGCEVSDDAVAYAEPLAASLQTALGVRLSQATEVAQVRHAYTHFRIAVHVLRVELEGEPTVSHPWDRQHWLVADEMSRYAFTGVTNKILSTVPWPGAGLLL